MRQISGLLDSRRGSEDKNSPKMPAFGEHNLTEASKISWLFPTLSIKKHWHFTDNIAQ